MRIEALSIRAITVIIILMIGAVASVLSLFAGSYFRQAALDAQVNSLSRVIEVASQEMLKAVRGHTFELGMRLGHSDEMLQAIRAAQQPGGHAIIWSPCSTIRSSMASSASPTSIWKKSASTIST